MVDTQEQLDVFSSVLKKRSAGILLHPTSLPGSGSTGKFDADAYRFIDFIDSAGMAVWQVLPLNEVHPDGSPYQCQSAHAGDTRLIDWSDIKNKFNIDIAVENIGEFIDKAITKLPDVEGDYQARYESFLSKHYNWLDDFILYRAIKVKLDNIPWWEWPDSLRDRNPDALHNFRVDNEALIARYSFMQFVFFEQWHNLRAYANERSIKVFGDMPIFVSHDSSDVWANRDLFDLDESGLALSRSGVPPDYFSATGQLWGNPLYRWDKMQSDNFDWWKKRLSSQLELYDFLRVDHFRGFDACWSVPSGEQTAINGYWVEVPGRELFSELRSYFGFLPIVAEDLGVITQSVVALRDDYGLPGMKILQFAFDSDAHNPYLPHNHIRNCVVYTGTHDNDTTLGWFEKSPDHVRKYVTDYLGDPSEEMPLALVRNALASVAHLTVIPLQDLFSLGSAHRMNTPGTISPDNWGWRFNWDMCPDNLDTYLRQLCEVYGRSKF